MACPLYNNLGHSNHGHRSCIHRRLGGTGKTVNDKGTRDALTTAAQKRHIDEFFFLWRYTPKKHQKRGRKQGALNAGGQDKTGHDRRFEALGPGLTPTKKPLMLSSDGQGGCRQSDLNFICPA